VSTREQNADGQLDVLERAGVDRKHIYVDKASGKLARRPQLDRMMEFLREGDIVVTTKLDRLGRSLRHLMDLTDELRDRGIGLRVLSQGIDTTTPAGRMFFQIIGAISEFEASLISERTLDGLEAARARSRKGGRKPKLSDRQVALIRTMHASGEHTITALADTFKVTRPTIYRVLELPDPAPARVP